MKAPIPDYPQMFLDALKELRDGAEPQPLYKTRSLVDTEIQRESLPQRVANAVSSGSGFTSLDLERMQGTNDLVRINFLTRGVLAARTVCRICIPTRVGAGSDWGTGFLVGPRLLLTNYHVLPSIEDVERGFAEFGYESDSSGRLQQGTRYRFAPRTVYLADKDLDFALIALEEISEDGGIPVTTNGFIRMNPQLYKVNVEEFVTIIQHASGDEKVVGLRENRIVKIGNRGDETANAAQDNFIWYVTDTAPGSSGAPVFNDQWQVVALHHSGVPETRVQDGRIEVLTTSGTWIPKDSLVNVTDSHIRWIANEGVRISKIVERIGQLQEGTRSPLVQALLDDANNIRPYPGTHPREAIIAPQTAPVSVLPRLVTPGESILENLSDEDLASVLEGRRKKKPQPPRTPVVSRPGSSNAYANRTGFDENFLGVAVPLPQIGSRARQHGEPVPMHGTNDPVLRYTHFSVVMCDVRRQAFYSAVNIDGVKRVLLARENGESDWKYDPRIPAEAQIGNELYGKESVSGGNYFDRGHLTRRQDPIWGDQREALAANNDTFHWTNCSPQYYLFNQGEDWWQGLENYILNNTDEEDIRANVFSGPIFSRDDEMHRGIGIPQMFWKLVVVRDQAGKLYSSAYVISQEKYARDIPFEVMPIGDHNKFQVRVPRLEELTGLIFSDEVRAADAGANLPADRPLRGMSDIVHPRRGRSMNR